MTVTRELKMELSAAILLKVLWDGQLMEHLTANKCNDQLPILISSAGVEWPMRDKYLVLVSVRNILLSCNILFA